MAWYQFSSVVRRWAPLVCVIFHPLAFPEDQAHTLTFSRNLCKDSQGAVTSCNFGYSVIVRLGQTEGGECI
eukprot:3245670-Rhodomonas_salina.3